jgi:amino acid adenylation domain-containing protein
VIARYLPDYLESSAAQYPDKVAVFDPSGRTITYGLLNQQADALAGFLCAKGVKRGDRVGVVLPKSIDAVVALFGILKAGAAYVPVDYLAPAKRGQRILGDCRVRAVVIDSRCTDMILPADEPDMAMSAVITVDPPSHQASGLEGATTLAAVFDQRHAPPAHPRSRSDLAYILYTSGSTGMPKGVMLTHENALSFVEWSSDVFEPTAADRFSSHAPFHFDLSILDIYLCVKHAAELHLVSEELGKNPKDLAELIAARQLTIWYSTPSILTLLVQFGHLDKYDYARLRLVLFAGEVFPVKHLRMVQRQWPGATFYNLYGPTETNVCTFARIPENIPDTRDTPYPIGRVCEHCRAMVLDNDQAEVPSGKEGLLYISGSSVFSGYWNRPAETANAFVVRRAARWYNTGDVVRSDPQDGFVYVGRNDRMVKRRGYRIELGEIERALYLHRNLREAAVVSVTDAGTVVEIIAFLSCQDTEKPSIIELKTFCKAKLPAYMIPDRFVLLERLPRTSTDKVDYQTLTSMAPPSVAESARA